MKKYMILVAVLVAVAFALPAFAQSGLTDERIGANAQIKMSKIKPVQFSSAPSAATWFNATLKTLAKGDFYLNTTSNTFHYYNGSAWTLIGGGSAGVVIIAYAGEPNAAQYLAASGKALAVNDLVFDTTAKVLKQCTNLTGPVYRPAIYSAAAATVNLYSAETNAGTGIGFSLDAESMAATDTADYLLQLKSGGVAQLGVFNNGDALKLTDQALTIKASKTNAGSDTAIILDNVNALAAPDSLVSIRNAGTIVLEIDPASKIWGMVATNTLTLLNTFAGTGAAGEIGIMLRNDGSAALAADDILVSFVNEATTVGGLYADGRLALGLGAVTTPSFTFGGDLDTGIYSPGAEQVSVTVTGAQVMNFTAATVTIPTGVDLAIAAGGDLTIADPPTAGADATNKTYVDNALLFGTQLTAAGGVEVNLGLIAITPLYTCPAARTCVIEKVVFRSASASVDQAADATYDIGWQAVASGVVASVALVNPTATTTSWHPVVVGVHTAAEQTVGAAAEVLNFNVTAACTTDPTTIRVDVFGYSY